MRLKRFLFSTLLLLMPAITHAQSITAVWDPNPPEDQIFSYQVCIGTTPLSCNLELATVQASETSYSFTPNPGILYRVAVRAVNASGVGSYSPEVTVSIPGLTQPANQTSVANVAISPLSLSASDPDGSSLTFAHSGLPFGLSLNSSTGIITGTPTSSGVFNVTVFVSDDLNTTQRSFVWTVQPANGSDTSAPSLSITSHTAGQTVNTSSITLAGTATDSGSGGNGIVSVTVNGAAASGGTANGSNTANWSRSVSLSTGVNPLTVVATDGAGNVRTLTVTITRSAGTDTTAPALAITSHTSNQTVGTSSITLSGTASDNGAGGSGIAGVTVNGIATGATALGNNTANWSRAITLAAGANTVTVVATDGVGNARTTPITITYVTSVSSPTLTASLASPRLTGTTITFTAGASGGAAPYSYKWWILSGGTWTMARDWGTSPTFSWTPSAAGSYQIAIWVRDANTTTDTGAVNISIPYVITAAAPTTLVATGISADPASPRPVGTTVTFTAGATGGTAPYSYKWWVQIGGVWSVAREWSSSPTLTWQPTTAGTYTVAVWVRNAGVTADAGQALAQVPYVVSTPGTATSGTALSVSLTSNMASPQVLGTAINFTAAATGGTAPYSYKWWVQSGGVWSVAREWSSSPALTWQPTTAGTYMVAVWVRNAGATADASQALAQVNYVVSPPPGALSIASLTSTLASPQPPSTSIGFTAAATGGTGPHQYKWWVFDGTSWSVAQNWSTSASLNWRPTKAGTYIVAVWGRNAGVTADASQALAQVTYSIGVVASLSSTLSGPQRSGTSITFTATAARGIAPYQYKWWVFDGTQWSVAQNWSTSATLDWRPTTAGTYFVAVWIRNAGSTADASEALAQVPFAVY